MAVCGLMTISVTDTPSPRTRQLPIGIYCSGTLCGYSEGFYSVWRSGIIIIGLIGSALGGGEAFPRLASGA